MRPLSLLAALTALALVSCYSPGDGQAPPLNELYFPTGLALDRLSVNTLGAPRYLYAASSDFDLQFRSSGLISYDLDLLRAKIPRNCTADSDCLTDEVCDDAETPDATDFAANKLHAPSYFCVKDLAQPCGSVAEQSAADRLLYPGRCQSLDAGQFIHSTVGIGAFATNVVFAKSPPPEAGGPSVPSARLFLPVRGDATLHWIDLVDGNLECGQDQTSDGSCAQTHRAGHDPSASNNNYTQLAEPFGIAVTQDGDYVAITNQTTGSVSLYKHEWPDPATAAATPIISTGPQLVSVAGYLPSAPVAIAAVPNADRALVGAAPAPGFLVAYKNAAEIDLLRVRSDDADTGVAADTDATDHYSRYLLTFAGSASINANSLGFDSRDILIDDSQRQVDYNACAADGAPTKDCLLAAHQPQVYVTNRAPSSLLVGAMLTDISYASGTSDLPFFNDSIPLTVGPSRVVRGSVRVAPSGTVDATHGLLDENNKAYDLEPRLFVICFDSTRVFVYDPQRKNPESIIDTGRGPSALVVDEVRGLAYVAFFTDSYLGVVSLDQRYPQNYATIVASIGIPTPPRTSK